MTGVRGRETVGTPVHARGSHRTDAIRSRTVTEGRVRDAGSSACRSGSPSPPALSGTDLPAEIEVMRVLLIEDHKPLARTLRQGLEEEGFAVDVAYDGQEGDFKARGADYDVIILDMMLPKEDGMSLLQRWRKDGLGTHVLVLTARGGIEDKVRGLDGGADDYMTKPFELEELLARLRALIRRRHHVPDPVIRIHDLEIDTSSRTVKRSNQIIHLTPREYSLLEFLAFHRGK